MLVIEAKGQDCTVSTTQVQGQIVLFFTGDAYILLMCCVLLLSDAARTFFQSKMQQETLKSKGKYSEKGAYQRRRNRLLKVYLIFDLIIVMDTKHVCLKN